MTRITQESQESPVDIEHLREQNATMERQLNRLENRMVQNHNDILARLDSLPIISASSAASPQVVASISLVKYVQDAAVLANLVARWIDPTDGSMKMKEIGPYKAVGTRQEFNLMNEGLPNGASVRLSSYVVGVGEYEDALWFRIDSSESNGAIFRQTGTAFKGWFQYTGLYRPFIAHDNVQAEVGAISRVKYIQNAAVSAYLLIRWIHPTEGIIRRRDLGPWKAIATQEEFNLVEEGIPDGSSVQFASYVAGVGGEPTLDFPSEITSFDPF
ncbi:hypothetical protein K438DRAFT_1831198 [Mycena galopus ATCC 62051]|nr:hypothetical protein K438DRAFT_1831198 [Mycena galopus ATCC 62051]